jgi:hypothetical protein
MPPTNPETRVAEAYQAALALVWCLKAAPPITPKDYADLRLAALRATVKARDAASYWAGQPPEWSPEAVQRAVAEHFKPVPAGTLEGGLLREVRDTAERPVNAIARPQWSDGGWLDEMLNAYDLLTADYANCDAADSVQGEAPEAPDTPTATDRHPDGPEQPLWLWWRGVRHHLALRSWALLAYLWPRQQVAMQDVATAVWENEGEEVDDAVIRTAIHRLNVRLGEIGVPFGYRVKSGQVVRE